MLSRPTHCFTKNEYAKRDRCLSWEVYSNQEVRLPYLLSQGVVERGYTDGVSFAPALISEPERMKIDGHSHTR